MKVKIEIKLEKSLRLSGFFSFRIMDDTIGLLESKKALRPGIITYKLSYSKEKIGFKYWINEIDYVYLNSLPYSYHEIEDRFLIRTFLSQIKRRL